MNINNLPRSIREKHVIKRPTTNSPNENSSNKSDIREKSYTASVSDDEAKIQRIYALKAEKNQQESDAILLGQILLEKTKKEAALLEGVRNNLSESNKLNQELIQQLKDLENKISASSEESRMHMITAVKSLVNNIEEAGRAYSKGQCEKLNRSIRDFEIVIRQGEEALEFWDTGKKFLLGVLTIMLLFQFYYNYKLSEQLNYLNNQVSMLHTLYKGESKYWFDTSNKKLYVETKKTTRSKQ